MAWSTRFDDTSLPTMINRPLGAFAGSAESAGVEDAIGITWIGARKPIR